MLRRTLLAVAALALAASLTACGAGVKTSVESALDPVAAAADKSATAGGVKVSIKATFTTGTATGGITADGVFDEDKGELTVDLSNLASLAPGSGAQTGLDGKIKLIYLQEDGHTILYVNAP